ncbi:MAG TPA: calcium-binding protein, partial [Lacipirellulaceae bacterium]|nr:calcium-binding protein [Lacipirellulaceae bacterium]
MAVYQFSVNVSTNANLNVIVQYHDETGTLIDAFNAGTLITWSYGIPNPIGVGDSLFDELIGSGANDYIFWDWETADFGTNPNFNGAPTARYFPPGGSQIAAIDIFSLGDGDDIISLTYNRHVPGFQSYDWAATIYGGNGNDLIMSGNGNDMLFGGNGRDTIYGGGGDDVIVLEGVAEGLGEFAFGGSGNDTIYGTSGNDSLYGGDDDDYLEGFGGVDEIYGGAGNDTIYGGPGGNGITTGDILNGGAGNDTIYGGDGKDFIEG